MTELMNRLAALAQITDGDGLTRLFLSPAHQRAAALVQTWMEAAGLTARLDAIGNVVGHNRVPGPTLIIGSHIDTVRNAGWYDGNYGVLAAIEALRRCQNLPVGVEVIAFGDEEGVRFPKTLSGSRAVAGIFDPVALASQDSAGITMSQALKAFGGDPDRIAAEARDPARILAYVELHIEQGPVLEAKNLPAGIVTAIAGASRYQVTVTGAAGHAGTIPMPMRRDALTAAAEFFLAVEATARAHPETVATVGAVTVRPGAPNSIPGEVIFTIDLRAPEDATRRAAAADIEAAFTRLAAIRGVTHAITQTHDAPATACAPWLQSRLATAVETQNIPPFHLPSGAGHDAMALAAICPVGMLFIRCAGGISHTPAESITPEDAEMGVRILVSFLQNFAPEPKHV
jgi:allantoate deiminase